MPGDVFLSIEGLGTGGEAMQRRECIQRLNMSVLLIFQDHQLITSVTPVLPVEEYRQLTATA